MPTIQTQNHPIECPSRDTADLFQGPLECLGRDTAICLQGLLERLGRDSADLLQGSAGAPRQGHCGSVAGSASLTG